MENQNGVTTLTEHGVADPGVAPVTVSLVFRFGGAGCGIGQIETSPLTGTLPALATVLTAIFGEDVVNVRSLARAYAQAVSGRRGVLSAGRDGDAWGETLARFGAMDGAPEPVVVHTPPAADDETGPLWAGLMIREMTHDGNDCACCSGGDCAPETRAHVETQIISGERDDVIRILASVWGHVMSEEQLGRAISQMPGVDSEYTIDLPVVAVRAASDRWTEVRARWGHGLAPCRGC
jgi:hypothetical protein